MNILPRKNHLVAKDPLSGMLDLQQDINDLFDLSFSRWPGRVADGSLRTAWAPNIDVVDEKEHLTVKADLPGLKREDIHVSVEDGVLTIQGEKKSQSQEKGKDMIRVERVYGNFLRSIELPSAVDGSKAKASYKDGVLELTLPKKEEAKPKQIQVNVE